MFEPRDMELVITYPIDEDCLVYVIKLLQKDKSSSKSVIKLRQSDTDNSNVYLYFKYYLKLKYVLNTSKRHNQFIHFIKELLCLKLCDIVYNIRFDSQGYTLAGSESEV